VKRADEAAIVARLRAAGCVYAEAEAELLISAAATLAELDDMVDRRASGLPLEHIVGWAEFCGLRIAVSPGVFVPRRRSEFLVGQAVAGAPGDRTCVVVDLCCGSGAVGVAVATALGGADLYASDIEPAAVACASANVAAVGGTAYEGDLYDPLPPALRGRVDLVVVNAPYVPTSEIGLMPAEARLHEPRVALDGGPDGVAIHRRVAAQAAGWLAPDGRLLIETSERQALLTEAAMTSAGLTTTVVTGHEIDATLVTGRLRR
jgi:release factor glutamine methyltransferase